MNDGQKEKTVTEEVSVRELFKYWKNVFYYVKSCTKTLLICAITGALLGLALSFLKKPVYSAVCTFVLEEGDKAGALGQYAGLASLAGIDLSGSSSGVFQGENIVELYKSRLMIEKTLLTKVNISGKQQKLIDRYITFNRLGQRWKDEGLVNVNFDGDPAKFTRLQDSLITNIAETFNKKNLTVAKPDKKLSILKVVFASKDEMFAKYFVDNLVANVNEFYVKTKTKKNLQNVKVLERQKDSVRRVLDASISGVASALDAAPNANPAMLLLRVPSQKKQVDVQASSTVYAEIVKNLELSKVSLMQSKPLIQIIDTPIFPLEVSKIGKVTGPILGMFILLFAGCVFLIIKYYFKYQ